MLLSTCNFTPFFKLAAEAHRVEDWEQQMAPNVRRAAGLYSKQVTYINGCNNQPKELFNGYTIVFGGVCSFPMGVLALRLYFLRLCFHLLLRN